MTMRTFQVAVLSQGVATITAPTKAAAERRARARDYDSYELCDPTPQITSLAEGAPKPFVLPPVRTPVVFRSGS